MNEKKLKLWRKSDLLRVRLGVEFVIRKENENKLIIDEPFTFYQTKKWVFYKFIYLFHFIFFPSLLFLINTKFLFEGKIIVPLVLFSISEFLPVKKLVNKGSQTWPKKIDNCAQNLFIGISSKETIILESGEITTDPLI